ncbi:MAG: sugar kinase [Desulfobacterales bacterium]|nr:sugar kinase [Deltaproteobacteria bacterium]NNK92779.1 sugar kinase [Desulfobacterales bacterium]
MKKFTISLIGECMIEIQEIEPGVIQQTFGGDTLNTAIYMARLSQGLPVQVDYVTALGTDQFSDLMVAFWEKEQVGSSMVQRIEGGRPGLYYIQLDEDGERVFHYWRGEAIARQCFEQLDSKEILTRLGDYDAIYLSGISLAILLPESRNLLLDRLSELHSLRKEIYFDCNYRPHLWQSTQEARTTYKRILTLAHTVLLNVEEGIDLLEQKTIQGVHSVLGDHGVRESVIRDGGNPCSVFCDGSIEEVAALPVVRVVDTTAAGDSFSAAYLLARRFGQDPCQAVLLAHQMATYVISNKGAVAPRETMPFTGEKLLKTTMNKEVNND